MIKMDLTLEVEESFKTFVGQNYNTHNRFDSSYRSNSQGINLGIRSLFRDSILRCFLQR